MTDRESLRCAYIVSRYPSLTHTFVLREVLALRKRGLEVATVTVRRPVDGEALAAADRIEAQNTHAILPVSPTQLIGAHLRAIMQGPRAYAATLIETLRDAPAGIRAWVWQLFYFVEAIVFWRWLEARGLRHVHAHHANVGADLAMIATRFDNGARGPRMSWSLTVHGPTELADVPGHKLATKVARADAVVAISDFVRAQLLTMVDPREGEKIRTIRCGVDPSGYEPADDRSHDGPLRVLSVARLARRKGQETLLEALAQLRRTGVEAELTIVGDGPARQDIERRAGELGIDDVVTFAGALGQDQVAGYYARADAFCLPSFSEGLPIVLMEAMASGLPVVATGIMGVPELVEDGCGLLVPPARPDMLAGALARLAGDPQLRRDLGAAARRKVESDFTLDRSAAALEAVFRQVTSAGEGQAR